MQAVRRREKPRASYLLAAAVFTVNALQNPYYGRVSSASVLARRAGNGVCCGIRALVVF